VASKRRRKRRLRLARSLFEERLPALEERCQVVARRPVGGDEVDVRPVLCELPLELRYALFAAGDLALDEFQGRLPLFWFLRPPLPRFRRWRRFDLRAAVAVLRPAARVGNEVCALDREQPARDGVEERAVVRHEQNGARKRLERGLEGLATHEIEVVG